MRIARVVGQVVSTAKPDSLSGRTLLLVRGVDPEDPAGPADATYAAVDLIGAGRGEVVIVSTGSAARVDDRTGAAPIDAAVIAIIDSLVVDGRVTYDK